jgi:hypothetical protein
MEIIDELEPVTRGPYTGALGYLGFNRQSQLSILIRTAICRQDTAWFHVGAGIVADSCPRRNTRRRWPRPRVFSRRRTFGVPPPARDWQRFRLLFLTSEFRLASAANAGRLVGAM